MVRVVMRMAEEEALMCYQATMRIARQWLCSGLITAEDYEKFDTIVAEKFGVSARSIWRDINLIKLPCDKDAMKHSLAAQISYYNEYIQCNPDWVFAGIYAEM